MKKMPKKLTPTQYAALKGWTHQNVSHQIRGYFKGGKLPPGVIEIEQWGRFYLLVMEIKKLKTRSK